MTDAITIYQLLKKDPRYVVEAYEFVRNGLTYATEELQLGKREPQSTDSVDSLANVENHLTGQELSEGIRQYAINQYGYMAKSVLNSWGIHSTSDFGNIVYNMIDIGLMKKSDQDRREHFDDVFDFQEAFVEQFSIQPEN